MTELIDRATDVSAQQTTPEAPTRTPPSGGTLPVDVSGFPRGTQDCGGRNVPPELVAAMIELQPGGLVWRRVFAGTADQVPEARRFIRYLLADADEPLRQDAELIVSELAGNAVRHTSSGGRHGTFIVEMTRTVEQIRVAVYDCGWGGVPKLTPCRTGADCGRGLAIVAELADATGYEGSDDVGHVVWATLTRPVPS
jgi:serine/threonine-protein kinase RsbW